ncbi:hypothetical protein MFIFM68171_06559 [Madurella fahalii]|uniref:Uncharacterized protein n=1 Tax=Madurella fahalii TaxID=1157608 RepID=A0ABQ0GF96_9PEZI
MACTSAPRRLVSPPAGGQAKPIDEFTREEVLWLLRVWSEGAHRHLIHLRGVTLTYQPSVQNINHLPEMDVQHFKDTCNKTVPFYILANEQCQLVFMVLHNYIYRRWLRPYRSEIEYERYICKFISPLDLDNHGSTPPSTSVINSLISLNNAICTQVQALHHTYAERAAEYAKDPKSLGGREFVNCHEFYVLQPLFRALLIVVCCDDYANENSNTVGRLPVFMVRTGVQDGLSAPITFESIADKIQGCPNHPDSNVVKTSLETAVDFIMGLEAREAAAFGLQPDPVAVARAVAESPLRWPQLQGDSEVLRMPSSQFVSDEKALEWGWIGDGKHYDSKIMAKYEERAFCRDTIRALGLSNTGLVIKSFDQATGKLEYEILHFSASDYKRG